MLRHCRRVLSSFWAVLGLLLVAPAWAAPVHVSSIAVAEQAGVTRVTIELSQRADYRVFFLAEPMRAVIDLPPVTWSVQGAPRGRGLIAGYRYGQFDPQTARLVIDLAAPARVRQSRYDLPAGGHNRLIIELENTSTAEFEQQVQPWTQSVTKLAGMAPVAVPEPRAGAISVPSAPRTEAPSVAPAATPAATRVAAVTPFPTAARPSPRKEARRVVVLDAGHGGVDPGAIGVSGVFEKDVTLSMAREIKRQLEATGRYRVVLTRDDDVFIRLRDRLAQSRAAGAELFVSIHADSMRNRETRGASVYTLSEHASDDEAAALATRENRVDIIAGIDLSHENKDVMNILIDLAQRETMNHSATFAGLLVGELEREIPLVPLKPHRFAGFAVLKAPDVPSVLIELGYLSNRADEQQLTRPHFRTKIASSITHAIDRYFQKRPPMPS
jgi:N-acetylmuramoyl-L-alanine amidase